MDATANLTNLAHSITAYFAFDAGRLAEPEMILRLALQVMLLLGSAFFSGSETAVFSLSQLDLQRLRRQHHPQTNTLYRLLEQPRRLIISILCGNELINVAAAANMAAILVSLYGTAKAQVISIGVMVPLLLLFGEVTPKTIAVTNPVRISARVVAAPLLAWVNLVTPLRHAIRAIADRVTTWIVGAEKAPENILQVDEFKTLVDEVAEEGGITTTERTLVYNLLAAGATEIVEIMTPRTQTVFIDAAMPMTEIVERVRQYRYNRLPVFRGQPDNFIGFLHAEDFIALVVEGTDLSNLKIEDVLHPPVAAPPTKNVDEMFDFFQTNNAQAAMVIDEFGGVDGMITMKAVLRFIFGFLTGPVAGQHLYEEQDENRYIVPGDMKLSDFNNLTRFGLDDPRMTTVGGVVFRHLDRLPQVGDTVTFEGITMTVLAVDGHRIARVQVELGGQGPTEKKQ